MKNWNFFIIFFSLATLYSEVVITFNASVVQKNLISKFLLESSYHVLHHKIYVKQIKLTFLLLVDKIFVPV